MKAFKIILPVLICILMISCGYITCLKHKVNYSKINVDKLNIEYTPKPCENYPVERREDLKWHFYYGEKELHSTE